MECLRTNKHEMKNIKMGADEEWTLCDKKEVLELDISYPIEKIHAQTFGIKISTGKYKAPVDFTQEFFNDKTSNGCFSERIYLLITERLLCQTYFFRKIFIKLNLFANRRRFGN